MEVLRGGGLRGFFFDDFYKDLGAFLLDSVVRSVNHPQQVKREPHVNQESRYDDNLHGVEVFALNVHLVFVEKDRGDERV
jgi:hypothetical protein